ncbi:hypothetical protein GGI1_11798 [Acidithiobacillus sp. GGI-221]|nr:hypothetical protein GGI1_11798 [Acidithiobacillus sp. GGI-221]
MEDDSNNRVNIIFSELFLGKINDETAAQRLTRLPKNVLTDKLIDAFNRGETRQLYCNDEGEPYLRAR